MTGNMQSRIKRWICLVMVGLMISTLGFQYPVSADSSSQELAEMKLMKQRAVDFYISKDIINDGTNGRVEWTFKSQAGTYLSSQKANGSWSDVDYTSTASSANGRAWSPYLALDRMQSMAQAFADPKGPYYHDEAMLAGIQKALDHWFKVKPTSTNWWETGIGKQLRLSKIALLCEGYLTAEQAAGIVDTLDSKPNTIDGANSSWYNQNYMIRGLLLEDAQNVRSAVEAFNVLSAVTETLTGIQSDMSFFMHGKTNYTTGYGRSFARDMSFWAYVVSGTSFAYSQAAIDSLSSYVLDGTRYLVRGDVADLGMGMNGPEWPDYESSALTFYEDPLEWMQAANPKRADEFAVFLNNIRGIGTVSGNGLDANNMTQWQTLVSSHMRKDYGITVKMSSSTVKGGEMRTINPSGYNLLYWTPQGATAIQRTGDEYRIVYPLMDWNHVPGTTAPYVFTKENNFNNPKTFVGGVTNERYGATAFDFNKLSTSGKKGYFFFDDEMVALGAGITSTNAAPVHTTLNQSLAVGDVLVDGKVADGTSQVNGRWAYNDQTGYVFLDKTNFQVKRETKTGKWSDVVTGSSAEPITKPVFSMWLDHGVKPVNASYQYIVLPGKTAGEVSSYAEASPISILANTPSVQAVRHRSLGIAEMLFYQPGTVTLREGLTVTVDKPSMVIVDESADPVRISVANPETPGITVNVTLNRNGDQTTTTYTLGKDTFTGRSETLSEGAFIDDSGYDLAYSKGAAASSSVGKQFASNATDLYRTSSWSSNASGNEWIYVDLQDQYMINKVRLHWEKAYGKSYKIQVSDDAATWNDVYATSMGDGGIDDISFGKTSARFVRMLGVQQGTGDGYSLAEFNVYEVVAPNLAEGQTAIASSSKAADVPAGNAVDGSLTSRWGSNYADPQWIYVDLGSVQAISKVMLHWEDAYGKEYRIDVSDTLHDWKTVYSTSSGDGDVDEISIDPVNARYVRMYGTQRGSKYGYSLWEFKVFGPETQETVPARVELAATPSSAVPGGKVSVMGAVYADGNLPLSGVDVELTAADGSLEPAKVTTDVYGKFSTVFTAPSVPGKVSISAVLPASPSVTGAVTVSVEEEAVPVSARIELEANPSSVSAGGKVSVTGTVYDGEDLPLAGAAVQVMAASGSFEPALAVTDEHGRFSTVFTAPSAAGDVVITAVLTGNPSVTNTVTVSVSKAIPVPALIELQAAPSAVNTGDDVSITGIVSGSDNLPVSGLEVGLTASSGSLEPAHAVTDANGRFSAVFTAPSTPGEVTITAVLNAYPSITGRISVSVNERSGGGNGGNPGGEAPVTPSVPVPPVVVGTPGKPDESPQGPATPAPGPSLTDIAGHWAEASISEAVRLGIITGYPNGSFQPNRNVTRAEFTVMLAKALKLQNTEAALSFKDSDRIGPWAKIAVAQAVALGIIQGDNNSNFRPDAPVTRAEMAVMLARALQLAPVARSAGFTDDRDIPAWAVGAAAEMKKSGLMQGKGNNSFFPKDAATRAETVTVLLRMLAAK
ncbi:polysaccharide lyase family 8 super-sandwich domain-containing protein [Paenibacillus sp. FSL R7-269]|uniref:polysaccharide lyase family 8 super-sandwich domain-containing protein n=1 Tax=Paenibacillus sp. FSL R7-269 TaxID=1226755 RepID=UPI000A03C8D6|nr:polysaccharide lyase family 8 super-sandwich domain-containing protein [Paenibacillus sp. FSL R7-269]